MPASSTQAALSCDQPSLNGSTSSVLGPRPSRTCCGHGPGHRGAARVDARGAGERSEARLVSSSVETPASLPAASMAPGSRSVYAESNVPRSVPSGSLRAARGSPTRTNWRRLGRPAVARASGTHAWRVAAAPRSPHRLVMDVAPGHLDDASRMAEHIEAAAAPRHR